MKRKTLENLTRVSEHTLMRDLAELARIRAEEQAMIEEIASLRDRAAREIAMIESGATPQEMLITAKWQAQADRRIKALDARRAEISRAEEQARQSAMDAFGRDRAINMLIDREKDAERERYRRRCEMDGIPV